MKKFLFLGALCIFAACSSRSGDHANKTQDAPEQAREYRHDYKAAEALYAIAEVYGISVSEEDFHELMESPVNAEKFLNNMFEAGIVLDKKSDILFWIVRLYNGLPSELEHLDLCRGLNKNCQDKDDLEGTDDDLVEALFRSGPASVDDVFGKTIDEDGF